ncbi:hypothetical protein TUM17576_42070 [Enterobacter hormaechei]|nr:hypothetical protein TUM17576_42070 [Enterobacter hormaechei]
MTALFVLFLLSQLTACVRTETKYVPVQPVPLPADLTADCPAPEIADPFTWGDSLALNELLLTALENCNVDKAKIREIEQQRKISTKEKPLPYVQNSAATSSKKAATTSPGPFT